LHRLWQLLLKALSDAGIAPDPQEAAAMGLLRLIHASELPDPGALLSSLTAAGEGGAAAAPQKAAAAPAGRVPTSFGELVKLIETSGKHLLSQQLHDQIGLVRFAPPELVLKPLRPLGTDWQRDLAASLKSATGLTWQVALSDEPSEPSLLDQEKIAEERVRSEVLADSNVRAVFESFPEAALESFVLTKGA
jgi:DNA polymerase-3 subunit gamma/tau